NRRPSALAAGTRPRVVLLVGLSTRLVLRTAITPPVWRGAAWLPQARLPRVGPTAYLMRSVLSPLHFTLTVLFHSMHRYQWGPKCPIGETKRCAILAEFRTRWCHRAM